MTAPYIFNATKINSQLLTGTMFILLSRGAECLMIEWTFLSSNTKVPLLTCCQRESFLIKAPDLKGSTWFLCITQ